MEPRRVRERDGRRREEDSTVDSAFDSTFDSTFDSKLDSTLDSPYDSCAAVVADVRQTSFIETLMKSSSLKYIH